ncbi:hypothetical protein [Rhizobium sp. 007]|uniref:hypothetical protein n=1 Tax=Rhizobium sp. 007 TaxID=2785056 RepID=UPI001890628B|nr:hypothetical protein [Rhizobium sp. 007]QPB18846.1 hypothetical protein ISN39_14605 [Rhizobium sp. 007]
MALSDGAGDLLSDVGLNRKFALSLKIRIIAVGPDHGAIELTHQSGDGTQPVSIKLDIALQRVAGRGGMIGSQWIRDDDDVIELRELSDNFVPQAVRDV